MTDLSRNRNVVNEVLAIGTHVFATPDHRGAIYIGADTAAGGGGGTLLVEFTYDDRDKDIILTGTNPAGDFAADVASDEWKLGVVAKGSETIEGPISAIKVTVAGGTVKVTVAPQPV
jgi:hypothetical protein